MVQWADLELDFIFIIFMLLAILLGGLYIAIAVRIFFGGIGQLLCRADGGNETKRVYKIIEKAVESFS